MESGIIEYYENYDEKGRLQRDNSHRIEYLTTIYYFNKLFNQNIEILDVCAGTGVYSFYLAEKGYHVTACDLVPHNVDLIKENENAGRLDNIQICNAMNLSSFKEESFDAVLCMGALYHLNEEAEKMMAIRECCRVLRPGGMLVLTYINKFAQFILCLDEELRNINEAITNYVNKSDSIFTFATPSEIEELAVRCNIKTVHNIAADGMVYALKGKLKSASNENFDKWFRYHISICEEPSILGASLHGLYIGKK